MRFRNEAGPGQNDCPVRMYHVSKSYLAGSFALHDVSLEIKKGEFVFLTGPSGAGKTTLLRMLFASERPSEGQILMLGRNVARLGPASVPALRRRIGFVFQDFKLLPRRSIEDNVRLALDVEGIARREARARGLSSPQAGWLAASPLPQPSIRSRVVSSSALRSRVRS